MISYATLYPPRTRAANVDLIKRLRQSTSQAQFEQADGEAAKELHPSLLAEMDWMEQTMPEAQREGGRRFVDGFFLHHLPAFVALRRAEFELTDEQLAREVGENLDFYRYALADDRQPLNGLGSELSARIKAIAAEEAVAADDAITHWCDELRSDIRASFDGVVDPDWVQLLIDCQIQNALALSLDHLSSREQTKHWLRQIGGRFPHLRAETVASLAGLDQLRGQVAALARQAREAAVYRLAATCTVQGELLGSARPSDFHGFSGTLACGYGHCGTCSMMYASTAIVSYDPSCPGLFSGDNDRITMRLDFNVSECPFCGRRSRAETPCLFYSPKRHQVIYNCPRLGQYSEDQARQMHRPMLTDLRNRYLARIGGVEATHFESAREEFTYSAADFLMAVQMGTTVREHHAYLVVRFIDGTGMLTDPTKGFMLELTREELAYRWAMAGQGTIEAVDLSGGTASVEIPSMAEARRAFELGDAARARDILEMLYERGRGNEIVRKNLAAALIKLGDRDAARRVLKGEAPWPSRT